MSIVYIENLPRGTKKEIEEAFKPFGKSTWTLLSTKDGYSKGFLELATSQHAAHFAELARKLELKRRIITKTDSKKASRIESVISLSLDVVTRRIITAIEQFKNQESEVVTPIKLDGTLDEEDIDPNLRQTIEAEILKFRKYAHSLYRTRQATASLLVDQVLNIDTPENLAQKRNLKIAKARESWAEFVRFANKCAQEEEKLRLHMKPQNDTPAFYLKYKSVPPNTTKPSFVARRTAELAIEAKVKREIREYKSRHSQTETIAVEAKSAPRNVEPKTKEKEAPPQITLNSLLEEYFGEVDNDLMDFIKESVPQGRGALIEGLKDLLLEETDNFVTKVMQIIK